MCDQRRMSLGFFSSLITHHSSLLLGPLQRAFAPSVIIANHQDADENKHLDERELGEREIFTHEDDCPRQQKDRLHIENQKEHRDNVIAHRKAIVRLSRRIDAALIRPHLFLSKLDGPQKTPEDYWQYWKD